jgi:Uncharacterised nucleotidyltransferase
MMSPAEELVCTIIRGDHSGWPLSDDSLRQVVEAAFHHNVHLVLFETLKKSSSLGSWPIFWREKLQSEVVAASVLDLLSEQKLRHVLGCLEEHGIRPLLLKGVPLAYTVYQSPALRPRGDTDILIRESDLAKVARILRGLGYDGPDIQTNMLASYECLYKRGTSSGPADNLDIHWKINNAQLFAKAFTFDELFAESIEIPSLADSALGLSHPHALLLACMHRFGHAHAPFYVNGNSVYAGDHLRWIYDIHLLCSALNSGQWYEFTSLARTKNIAEFCIDGLSAAREAFNTNIPAETIAALASAARNQAASAHRLRASGAVWFFANLRALPLRQRITLIKQVALPPSAYMVEKYRIKSRLALPFLYGYRSVKGILKWFKRSKIRNGEILTRQ